MNYLEFIGKSKLPDRYWDDVENVKHFMRYVAYKEGYVNVEDWYKCTRKTLIKYNYNI